MEMKVMLDQGAFPPVRAHKWDAGLDIFSPEQVFIHGHCSTVIDTGVHVAIPYGFVGMIKSKSGLNVKHDLIAEGVIDAGYTGSIKVKLYNLGDKGYLIHKGDKCTQLVILPVELPDMVLTDKLEETERGEGGFGSTGK